MRSTVFFCIFAVYLLALNCTAAVEGVEIALSTDQQEVTDSVVTTNAGATINAPGTETTAPKDPNVSTTPESDQSTEKQSVQDMKKPTFQPPTEERLLEEPQQQPPQLSDTDTIHNTVETKSETGDLSHSGPDSLRKGITEDTRRIEQVIKVEKKTGESTGDQELNGHGKSSSLQFPSSSSQSPGISVKQTPKKTPTPTITDTEHKLTEGTDSVPLRTEENPKKENNDQVKPPTPADEKTDSQHTNKIPITTADKTPASAEKSKTLTPASADNTVHQTPTITEDKKQNPVQTSVPLTLQPVKGESILPENTSEELSKAMQTLDNKDSSISSSLVCALAALATLVLVAVAPAF